MPNNVTDSPSFFLGHKFIFSVNEITAPSIPMWFPIQVPPRPEQMHWSQPNGQLAYQIEAKRTQQKSGGLEND